MYLSVQYTNCVNNILNKKISHMTLEIECQYDITIGLRQAS